MLQKTKRYLRQIKRLDVCIKQKEAELEELRCTVEGMSSVVPGDKVQTSPKDRLSDDIQRLIDLERQINSDKKKLLLLKNRIINEIQSVDNAVYVDILYKRYVEYMRLEEIAVKLHYSYDWTRHLHGLALQEFKKIKMS